MEEWKWDWSRMEGLSCQPTQNDRILPAREEENRALELGRDLAQNVDGFTLDRREMPLKSFLHRTRCIIGS
jgi:hypothetical protein